MYANILRSYATRALSSADRVPGYEPVGQRFESSRARQKSTCFCKSIFLSIAKTMVYHHTLACISSMAAYCRHCISYIKTAATSIEAAAVFVLIIYCAEFTFMIRAIASRLLSLPSPVRSNLSALYPISNFER